MDGLRHIAPHADVHGKPIPRTTWDDPQFGLRPDEWPGDLVHRAVAATGHHEVISFFHSFGSQFDGVAGPFGMAQFIIEPFPIEVFGEQFAQLALAVGAGKWIGDEAGFDGA